VNIFNKISKLFEQFAYPHSPNIMLFLTNSWDKFKSEQDAIESVMAQSKITYDSAKFHVDMASEEFGPVGSNAFRRVRGNDQERS
jgi:hypothetical protein